MTRPIQRTDLQSSTYERPDQAWVCGWAADGHACRMGPDPRGRCRTTFECTPSRKGDRWYCSRPGPHGGPCADGPKPDGTCGCPVPPCQPVRSMRARRGVLVRGTVALTLGVLAVALAGVTGQSIASPGDLAAQHSTAVHDCKACHVPAADGQDWFGAALLFRAGAQQSSRCLVCHRMGDHALLPHGVPAEQLAALTAERAPREGARAPARVALAALVGPPRNAAGGELACATCHREHQGRAHDLARLPDANCQLCHGVTFASFSDGHPEFHRVKRRHLGMHFDHLKHKQTNFGDAPFECQRCHQPDPTGRAMVLKPFANTCAGCHYQGGSDHHGEKITGAEPIVMVQLPMLVWAEAGHWSVEVGVAEEALPPLTHLLLAGDDSALDALRSLDEDARGYAADWEPDDEEIQSAMEEALQRLVRDLAEGDPTALRARVAAALGAAPTAPEVIALVEQLGWSRFAMRAYEAEWLPDLGNASPGGGENLETPGWHMSADDVAVVYKASGHGDPFLGRLVDALAAHVGPDGGSEPADEASAFRAELRRRMFRTLASADAGGIVYSTCLRCHSVETTDDGPHINWVAAGRDVQATGYAKFNHRPHLTVLQGQDACVRCHEMVQSEAELEGPEVSRAFLSHRKDQCTACHRPAVIQQDCLTCHVYHVRPEPGEPLDSLEWTTVAQK